MNLAAHAPILAIAVPLLGGFALPLWGKIHPSLRDLWLALVTSLTAALMGFVAVQVLTTGIQVYTLGASSPGETLSPGGFPIRIVLTVDALSAFMGAIATLLAVVAFTYAWRYLEEEEGKTLALTLGTLLWAGMLGMAFTGDLFNLFVFFEVTSIAACGLIGYRTWTSRGPEAAFKTMVMYTVGGLFVLLAIALLYGEYGALNLAHLARLIAGTTVDRIALGLLLGGFLMKVGAVPLHMWAPDAYGEAPAQAVILLVANTQTSLYALFRILFTLYGGVVDPAIGWLVVGLGMLTLVVAALMAVVQMDLGRLVAFGAVSQIGYMLLGVGVGLTVISSQPAFGLVAIQGGIFHMLNDAVAIGLLFLAVGAVEKAAGNRNLDTLGGLGHDLGWTTGFFLVGSLALAGIPPLNGFASKLMIYESSFALSPILAALAILASILLLAVFVRAFQGAFLGPRLAPPKPVPTAMLVAMGVLAVGVLALGLFPELVVRHLVAPAAKALWEGREAYLRAVLGG
ncbi:MAG: proton-conducting transporter membrane subunit [Candidatus Bipolaricaulis anaerobius]|nr:proton-conducting transporter membrane subunit [Candidatus Bipolaricaulis anaerobius]